MKKTILLLFLLTFSALFSQSVREMFSEVIIDWVKGDISSAQQKIEEIFYKPIPAENLAEFWYLRAKLMIETGRVREAYEDLKNLLVIVPDQPEVLSLVHNLEFILQGKESDSFNMKTLKTLQGFKDGIEYFLTPTDVAVFGESIYIVDPVNNRLIESDGFNFNVKTLSFQPEQVFTNRDGNVFLISRDGRVFKGKPLIVDAEVYCRQVVVLDTWSNSLIVINVDTESQKNIPLPVPTRSFEIFYDGSYLLLDQSGNLFHFDGKKLQTVGQIPQYVNIEYEYPYLFGMNWDKNSIEISLLKSSEPIFVHIDSFELTVDKMFLYVRVENAFGRDIDLVQLFSDLFEARGRVPFEVSHELREYTVYISDEEFLSKKVYQINDRRGYCVVVPPDITFSNEQLAVLKLKNVKLYTSPEASAALKDFCYKSGGGIGEPYFLKHNLWVFSFSYVKPITEEIIPISVSFKTLDMNYSDTIYVTKKVIELGLQ
ncbi:MAG: repeat-containing protein [Thermotoga sp.]|nr:repeat-containing protein [Thermotoga sp.]